ncbi:MAG: peptidase [Thermoleophilia bacterium]|nr:peptidase [Thermoleophilia bacterium]
MPVTRSHVHPSFARHTPNQPPTTEPRGAAAAPDAVARLDVPTAAKPGAAMQAPVGEGGISSPYGEREPASNLNLLPNGKEMHFGIDYARPEGTPIKAAAAGTVVVAGWNPYGAGNEVVIDHGRDDAGNHVYSRYMHQSALDVAVGAQVGQGDVIGKVGHTGAASGSHVHFQVSYATFGDNANVVDPNIYLSGARTFGGAAGAASAAEPATAPMAGAAPPATTAEHQGEGEYTVRPGDTLGVIATQHGMSMQALHALNADQVPNPNLIYPGQQLRLASAESTPAAAPAPAEAADRATYVVRAGDTLGGIAGRTGVTLAELLQANRTTIVDPDLIHPGELVRLPGGASGSGAAEPAPAPSTPAAPAAAGASRGEVDTFISTAAAAYGADANVLSGIARLESGYDTTDIANDWDINAQNGTPSKGMFQFIEPTFNELAPAARAANPDAWGALGDLSWTDWRQQALTTSWAITNGYGSRWATYAAAGGG